MPQAEELGHGRQREGGRGQGTYPVSAPRRPVDSKIKPCICNLTSSLMNSDAWRLR